MKKILLLILVIIIAIVFWGIVIFYFIAQKIPEVAIKNFGVTYSKTFAEVLGLDWQKIYEDVLRDLGISLVRIPVYWQEIEKREGEFDFSWLDWMLEKANDNNAEVILAVGRKVPRWPECHEPEWVQNYELKIKNQKLLKYVETTIKRYDKHPNVLAWQVENEPFLNFGICPKLDVEFLDQEIDLVRSIANKPIVVTDSGEFGKWFGAYKRADIFGSTMYRHVYSKTLGQITYPIPSWSFRLKKVLVEKFYGKKSSVVIELQAEPWGPKEIPHLTIEEQFVSMNPEKFKEMIEYAKKSGFDTFYLWGVEWWYWLKEQGHPEMLNAVKEEINKL